MAGSSPFRLLTIGLRGLLDDLRIKLEIGVVSSAVVSSIIVIATVVDSVRGIVSVLVSAILIAGVLIAAISVIATVRVVAAVCVVASGASVGASLGTTCVVASRNLLSGLTVVAFRLILTASAIRLRDDFARHT